MKAIFAFFLAFGALIPLILSKATTKPKLEKIQAQILKMEIKTKIQMRYAITDVELYVRNRANTEAEVSFYLNIPKEAFVSNYTLQVKNEEFVAIVQEKGEAEKTFEESYTTAGLVSSAIFNENKQQVSYFCPTIGLHYSLDFSSR